MVTSIATDLKKNRSICIGNAAKEFAASIYEMDLKKSKTKDEVKLNEIQREHYELQQRKLNFVSELAIHSSSDPALIERELDFQIILNINDLSEGPLMELSRLEKLFIVVMMGVGLTFYGFTFKYISTLF